MSADLLARLIAAGTDPTLVAEVAMALASAQASADAQIEAALAPTAGAMRTRRWRERLAASLRVTCDAALLRGSLKDQADFYSKALGNNGAWYVPNEVRAAFELDPRDDGNELPKPAATKPASAPKETENA